MDVNRGAFVGAIVLVVAVNIVLIAFVLGTFAGSGQLPAAPIAAARPAPAPVGVVLTPMPPAVAALAPAALATPAFALELRPPTAPAAPPPAASPAAAAAPPAAAVPVTPTRRSPAAPIAPATPTAAPPPTAPAAPTSPPSKAPTNASPSGGSPPVDRVPAAAPGGTPPATMVPPPAAAPPTPTAKPPTTAASPPATSDQTRPVIAFEGGFTPPAGLRVGGRLVVKLSVTNRGVAAVDGLRIFTTGAWPSYTVTSVEPGGRLEPGRDGWDLRVPGRIAPGGNITIAITASPNEPGNHDFKFIAYQVNGNAGPQDESGDTPVVNFQVPVTG